MLLFRMMLRMQSMSATALLQEITAKVLHSCRAEHLLHAYNQFLTQKSEQATLAAVRIGESRHAFNTILCIVCVAFLLRTFESPARNTGIGQTLYRTSRWYEWKIDEHKDISCPQRARYVRSY